ncbi:MAG TPA: CBS domain-containing protein [Stellaceae bacterium]|nr:CBS domain-containing protein [Stellaceae bacterium]
MKARDIMTPAVVSVAPDTPVDKVATVLSANHISAAPVVDGAGAPIGMVSEGDLIGRAESDREDRRDWWLTLLAEGEGLHPAFLANLKKPRRMARDVMVSPVITVGEDTDLSEIARVLIGYRIKRVPVMRDGQMVGIVSRADLVRAQSEAEAAKAAAAHPSGGRFAAALAAIDERFLHLRHAAHEPPVRPPSGSNSEPTNPTAAEFQHLVSEHEQHEVQDRERHREAVAKQRDEQVAELTGQHVSHAQWRALVQSARQAAAQGAKEFMMLQFPAALCRDRGREINANLPEWPSSLRGEAAELYLRWEHDLKPHGFSLGARVLDFPGGLPGDVGLFLGWGV